MPGVVPVSMQNFCPSRVDAEETLQAVDLHGPAVHDAVVDLDHELDQRGELPVELALLDEEPRALAGRQRDVVALSSDLVRVEASEDQTTQLVDLVRPEVRI
jgi:hypothetical protein